MNDARPIGAPTRARRDPDGGVVREPSGAFLAGAPGSELRAGVPGVPSWTCEGLPRPRLPLLVRVGTGLARTLSLQDAMMLVYLLVVGNLLWLAGPSAEQGPCARHLALCIAVVVAGSLVARAALAIPAVVRAVVYRFCIGGVLLVNYLMLRDLLPIIRPDSVDATLLRMDLWLFGVEPSIWLERLNTRPLVEWFSFFYFSYFGLCISFFLAVVCFRRGCRRTTEFAVGTFVVFCIGQLGYMAVPAYGPIGYLTGQFHAPVNGGMFWGWVSKTVEAGGAMKDVFPSLHTAVPSWFTLFALHQARTDRRWRWPARVTGFFALNIIFSTVFLRWHYVVDVVAGLALAGFAGYLSPRVVAAEERWRTRRAYPGAWTFA